MSQKVPGGCVRCGDQGCATCNSSAPPYNPPLLEVEFESGGGEPDGLVMSCTSGITLRDLFAGCALVGLISDPQLNVNANNNGCKNPMDYAARFAYAAADAMLRERAR